QVLMVSQGVLWSYMNIRLICEEGLVRSKSYSFALLAVVIFLRAASDLHVRYFCGMYSRQEASKLRQEFWTSFGLYMSPVASADGEKINWLNYKTGQKDIAFRMQADNKKASIGIDLSHKDPGMQQLYMEQFRQFKMLLEESVGEVWEWQEGTHDENGKLVSRIFTIQQGVNVFNKADWPALISFFKPRIIGLDAFWSSAKYAFESLR
ncbi:MAG TPA: DUF4268 domain-containing protein, partial [Flavisolibacter sp.]|nr:DUF4268 domain-containing protein [Flavisolibacter sp.]